MTSFFKMFLLTVALLGIAACSSDYGTGTPAKSGEGLIQIPGENSVEVDHE